MKNKRKVAVLSNSPVKSETPKSEGAERLESLRKQFPGKWSIGKFAGEEGLMKDGCFVMLTNEELVYMLNELDRLQPKAGGRPKGEPTKTMRVPVSKVEEVNLILSRRSPDKSVGED